MLRPLHRISMYKDLRACQRSLKLNYKSTRSGGCALWITLEQLFVQHLISIFQSPERTFRSLYLLLPNFEVPHLGTWSTSNDFETVMRIGQDLVESCQLRRPNKDIILSEQSAVTFSARASLLTVQYLLSTSFPSDLSKMCWEPELQEAERLYDFSGKWDVDEKCVSTLQTISVESLTYFLTGGWLPHFEESPPVMDELTQLFLSLSETPDISEHVLQFLKEYTSFLLQALWYPRFKRFLRYARQRSQDNSSIVSVSCKGF